MPALAVRDGPATADELLKLLRDAGKIAAVEPLILRARHTVYGAHAEHEIFGRALKVADRLVFVDHVLTVEDARKIAVEVAHIAVARAADARVRARAEAHIVIELPVLQVVPGLIARDAEVGDLVLFVAIVPQLLDHAQVHIRLLVVRRDEGRVLQSVHGCALLELEPVAGDVLRTQGKRLGERVCPVAAGLAGKTVDEVEADVVKPGGAGVFDGHLHLPVAVAAADHFQDIVVGRLHTDAQTVEARLAQGAQVVQADAVRVDLDGHLRALEQAAGGLDGVEQLDEPRRTVKARRAAAEIDRVDVRRRDAPGALFNVLEQCLLILRHALGSAGAGIEVTVAALARAKRDVDIDTETRLHRQLLTWGALTAGVRRSGIRSNRLSDQRAHELRIRSRILERLARDEQRLRVQDLGDARGLVLVAGGEGLLHGLVGVVVGVELQHAHGADVGRCAGHAPEVALHLERDAALGAQAHGAGHKLIGQAHGCDLLAERLLDEIEQLLVLGLLCLGLFFLFLALEAEIVGRNVAKRLVVVALHGVDEILVDLRGHAQDVKTLIAQLLCLRQAQQTLDVVAAREVDLRLLGGHGVDVFLEGDEFGLARVVEQQILDLVDLVAGLGDGAGAQHHAEGGVELLVLLTVAGHELRQLRLDLLAEVCGDELELAVMLQHLTRDVQRQVGGVDHAARERVARRQKVGASVHDHDAGAVELETGIGVARVHICRDLGRDEQQRAVGDQTLGVDADDGQRVVIVVELFLVKRDALLIGRLLAAALPDGDHAVDGLLLGLGDHLHLRLAFFVLLAGVDPVALLDVHDDRPADIVGVLADEHHELPVFEVGGVFLARLIGLDVHDDVGADGVLLRLGDGVAVRAGADPLIGGVAAVGAGDDRDLIGDHERGVEADAELTDDVDGGILLRALAEIVLELQRAAAAR